MADSDCLIQALSDIQAQNAQAKVESDLDTILEVIRMLTGGFPHMNQNLKTRLREWYIYPD